MKYRYFLAIGVLCFGGCTVLSWLHIDEDNSPLVFGLAALGLAAVASPLILSWAVDKGLPVRPSATNVLRSILIPLAGLVLLAWGLLGAAGVVPSKSFTGQRQHCKTCKTNWNCPDRREGPHYVDRCSNCATVQGLNEQVVEMTKELIGRHSADAPPRDTRPESRVINRSPVHVDAGPVVDLEARNSGRFSMRNYEAPEEVRLEIDGVAEGTDAFRLTLRLSLIDVVRNHPVQAVERTATLKIATIAR